MFDMGELLTDIDQTVETFEVFGLEGGAHQFVSRNGRSGFLELQALQGGPVYLFRGALTEAECEALTEGEGRLQFALGAAVGQASQMKLEQNPGEFTLYSVQNNTIGFVRIIQC